MPTYAYRCVACSHQFDAFQKFADEPLRECPTCGKSIRRVIHPVGVVFKGSGWYITDSRPKRADEGGAGDKSDKPDKSDKTDKSDKDDKSDKTERKDATAATQDKVAASANGTTAKASDAAAAD